MAVNKPVAVGRYFDPLGLSKEYIIHPETKEVKVFFNKDSAKEYLTNIFSVPTNELDLYLYDPVQVCDDCSLPYLVETSPFFTKGIKMVCESCFNKDNSE